jgi:electron transfer flavoprotein beta subunit
MAMGANSGLMLVDKAFEGSDGRGMAEILKAAVQKGNYDLVLCGAQADDGAAQVGGMLAALLDWPYASLVNKIETQDGKKLMVGREIEGGNQEINEIELPCVLSIQTGINEPRYVGIRGIRKVASVEIPVLNAAALGVDSGKVGQAAARVKRRDYFVPPAGAGAEILQGSADEIAVKLIELLKAKGGLK